MKSQERHSRQAAEVCGFDVCVCTHNSVLPWLPSPLLHTWKLPQGLWKRGSPPPTRARSGSADPGLWEFVGSSPTDACAPGLQVTPGDLWMQRKNCRYSQAGWPRPLLSPGRGADVKWTLTYDFRDLWIWFFSQDLMDFWFNRFILNLNFSEWKYIAWEIVFLIIYIFHKCI